MHITEVRDGIREELALLKAIPKDQPMTVDWILYDRTVNPQNLGRLVNALQDSAQESQRPDRHAGTKLLYFTGGETVVFDLVEQTPGADGAYTPYARIALEKSEKGAWALAHFVTSLDPSGYDKQQAQQYVDLTAQIKEAYKRPGADVGFAAGFLTAAAHGHFMWDALQKADLNGHIDAIFDKACKAEQARLDAGETPLAIQKSRDGHYPGCFEFSTAGATRAENRQTMAPVQNRR